MSTIRQQIVDAIDARMKLIEPGHTFTLPSGAYICGSTFKGVYQWRKVPFSINQVPALEFRDQDSDTEPGPSTQHEHKLHINLAVFFTGGTGIAVGRVALADIVAAVGSDPKWGGLARWTDVDSTAFDMEQAGDIIAGVQIDITVSYRTPLWRD